LESLPDFVLYWSKGSAAEVMSVVLVEELSISCVGKMLMLVTTVGSDDSGES
jgi:hypothetical protein